ncbi:hypothetical protein ABAC460_06530 [Asticcacaulis sp. AC460]|uniref:methyl-accepting chemotaxis protein n=1 Tax=Asticcacaulis sp. AC460 TaxID=1282360 RepID=UPI0003C3E235|nr:PAS domain-containing methyl-accepting chemotaxis protein [Asticcacaulis sp. AC460]ESQ91214.1 hypothetical protein ABAC460_06530 [Asticcacaulis sp. AC460]
MKLGGWFGSGNRADAAEALAIRDAINRTQAIIEFDLDGTIRHANDRFLTAMGYRLDEVTGRHHSMFVDPAFAAGAEYRQFWADLKAGVARDGEFRRKGKGGRDVFIEAAYTPVLDGQGRPVKVVKFAYDVTQRKLKDMDAEGKIAAIDRSQAVIEFALDGTVLTANDNFLNVMGYELREIAGRHHGMFVEESERNAAGYGEFWRRLGAGEFVASQFRRIGKGGREVIIQASYNPVLGFDGRPVKVVKFATDITERARRDADYACQIAAISRAQAVIEFALDGTVLTANDNFLHVMGYRLDDIRGRHHSMFVDEGMRAGDAYRQFWDRLSHGEYVSGEFVRVNRAGERVYIQASYNAILDSNGRPYKVVKYASDVTARRVALNRTTELSRSLQELSAAVEEMAVTGRSISDTMSHTRVAADKATQCVAEADESAHSMARAALQMDGIVDMITGITGQINLLALNATIESARAGEAGRGFAVVATEVKNLATQARRATEQIAAEIAGVRASSNAVVSALDMIRATVADVQEQVLFTAGAVEEQSATSQDMAKNMQIASTEADNIVRAA